MGLKDLSWFALLFALVKKWSWAYLPFRPGLNSIAACYINDSTTNFLLRYRREDNNLQLELPEKCHLLLQFCSSTENVESFCFVVNFPMSRVGFCDKKLKQKGVVKFLPFAAWLGLNKTRPFSFSAVFSAGLCSVCITVGDESQTIIIFF